MSAGRTDRSTERMARGLCIEGNWISHLIYASGEIRTEADLKGEAFDPLISVGFRYLSTCPSHKGWGHDQNQWEGTIKLYEGLLCFSLCITAWCHPSTGKVVPEG
uniref:Uncharacterized protein n=1 Tax=Falco tinnunculus TaxID=100819 RepID=A0A8C4UVS2_FALTI